jgi:glycosyltransferase involved in cell wall biosynthesis
MKISIIMPAFMAEEWISRAIESVLIQKYTNWELLIVNDGSSDRTEKIVLKYSNKDSRIRYFYQPNGGPGKARNLALNYVRGDLIAYLDADDVMLPNHLEVRYKILQKERVDIVFGPIFEVKDEKRKIFHGVLSDNTDEGCMMPSMLIHRKDCLQIGKFDENLLFEEDIEFFLRMADSFKTYQFWQPATVEYHIHGKGMHSLFERGGESAVLEFRNQSKRE